MTVSSDVSSWLRVCCSVVEMLSMSLVTRESSSPRGWPSKYRSGSRCSFSSTSSRSRYTTRWTTPFSSRPWIQPNTDDAKYSASTHVSTLPRAQKSMPAPGTCRIRSSTPSKMMSVACPRIFGPATANATLVTPSTTTTANVTRSGCSRRASRLAEGLKSLAFSTGMPMPGMPRPPIGGRGRLVVVVLMR